MTVRDYILLKKGFFNKMVYEQRLLRRVVGIITAHISPWLKNPPSIMKMFPIPGDKELKKQIKDIQDQNALETLKMHAEGGFTYVLKDGRIQKNNLN